MRKTDRSYYAIAAGLLCGFALFTVMATRVDVQAIGPDGSTVGFATLNKLASDVIGVHLFWYSLTDWLGVAAILVAFGFAALGLRQLIQRRSLLRVDRDILALGGFYLAVLGCYALFEKAVVNYRPIALHGALEASYPSSHTMIVLCVMATAMMQFRLRLRSRRLLRAAELASVLIMAVTVIGRLISGVHWCTDILGGALLSASLTMLYYSAVRTIRPARGAADAT